MSRLWIGAGLALCVSAFGISYALAAPDGGPAGGPPFQRLHSMRPGPPSPGWHQVREPHGAAVLAYPPGWRVIDGDPGTVTAALRSGGRIVGYLNATPQGGAESLANWLRFRADHNRDEGDRSVVRLAGARGLRFRGAQGSCLVDGYTSSTGSRYRELACIVAGPRATSVVVASAVQGRWATLAPVLRRAVSSFTT
jgi:hypothetical protein